MSTQWKRSACFPKKRHHGSGLVLTALVGLGALPSHAAVMLAIDIGRDGQAVEAGYTGFSTSGNVGDVYDPQAFGGGTWDIEFSGLTIFTRNYGDIETSPGGDLLEDSFLANTSGGHFDLVLDELAPGNYTLTTYHHSFAFGGASADVSGGADGDTLTALGSITSTTGMDISAAAVLSVTFSTTAEMDGYTLRFEPTTAGPSFHFDLSGFELAGTPVPLPPAFALYGAGLLGVAMFRRRRRPGRIVGNS